ncbi:MAG: alkaline phosphatase family protein [Minisyncoccia bacterium]
MTLPNYKNGSIVNLTSSILKAFNGSFLYEPLKELDGLKDSKNIALLVIDGLGYEYIKRNGENSVFEKHLVRSLTSVFPSTTASATTTFATGVAPQQHGITGWFMYLKELGVVSTILPFVPRYRGESFPNAGIERKDIYSEKTISEKIKDISYTIYPEKIIDGKVNKREKSLLGYSSLSGMFFQINRVLKSGRSRKYVYAYWTEFDSLCHRKGVGSKETLEHFRQLDKKITSFIKSLKGTETTLIITSDHGLIDTPRSKIIFVNDHPDLYETLTLPLCGEPRAAYCYVRPSKARQFEGYVKEKLGHCCELYKSEDLIKRGMFGLFSSC